MRILQLGSGQLPIPPNGYGAVERHISALTQALQNGGLDASVFNIPRGRGSINEARFSIDARRAVRDLRPDIVHCHTPIVMNAILGLQVPTVYTAHSRHWDHIGSAREWLGHRLEIRASREAYRTIAVSQRVSNQMERVGIKGTVVPNGVDRELFRPNLAATSDKPRHWVGIGAVTPHKRWGDVARALPDLPGTHLTICGPILSAEYAATLLRLAPGQISLAGEVTDEELVRVLSGAFAAVHPSSHESFGMAVIEAMSCGLPVLGSPAVSELIQPGISGEIIAGNDERTRSKSISEVMTNWNHNTEVAHAMGQAARRSTRPYAWNVIAGKVKEIYLDCFDQVP